jgi:beta-glucosidase-like glycosyl hydrolase
LHRIFILNNSKYKDKINALTSKQLAAQCIIGRLSAEDFYTNMEYRERAKSWAEQGIGGFCIFSGDMEKTAKMINELQFLATTKLFFCADFEFGLPMRLSGGTAFPHAMSVGKNDLEITYNVGKAIAIESKKIGVNWNLAPVCDVNSNKDNPIINIRAFGEDKDTVGNQAVSFLMGTQSENIMACGKHFPGHGDTDIDSHLSLPVLKHAKERIESLELEPFKQAIDSGVRSIMVAHLGVEAYDEPTTPATLSHEICTKLLREELGFEKIMITDGMEMKAISDFYSSGEAVIMAIEAGCDIVLLPENTEEALVALSKKAEEDQEFAEKLRESVARIFEEKEWVGLFADEIPQAEKVPDETCVTHEKLALLAASRSLEVIGEKANLPISQHSQIAGFAILQGEDMQMPVSFFRILQQALQNDLDFGFLNKDIEKNDLLALQDGIKHADVIVLAYFYRARAYHGSIGIEPELQKAIDDLCKGKTIISILFGNPYLVDEIKSDTTLITYTDTLPGIAASIMTLSGRGGSIEEQNEN